MDIFRQLLEIRDFREKRAQAALLAERAALEQARRARKDAADRLRDFRSFAKQREGDLFRPILGYRVQVRAIEDANREVGEMRLEERGFEDQLDQSEKAKARQEEVVASARLRHAQAERVKLKFVELVNAQALEAASEMDRKEESALEEVSRPDLATAGLEAVDPDDGGWRESDR